MTLTDTLTTGPAAGYGDTPPPVGGGHGHHCQTNGYGGCLPHMPSPSPTHHTYSPPPPSTASTPPPVNQPHSSSPTPPTATSTVTTTSSPMTTLPVTGKSNPVPLAALGFLLVAVGLIVIVAVRRSRRRENASAE